MQFDQQRAFPYPVLRPDVNDYTDGDFQVTPDIQPIDSNLGIIANFECALSVAAISNEIARGSASFAIVVSCRETYYRKVLFGQQNSIQHRFDGGSLRGEVQISYRDERLRTTVAVSSMRNLAPVHLNSRPVQSWRWMSQR
jgi:hypothetical protein